MRRMKMFSGVLFFALATMSLLFGCGGGSNSGTAPMTQGASGAISGTAVKGPVNGAMVAAYAITNGMMGTQLSSGISDSLGNFTLSLNGYSGPVMLQMSGGAYVDEATGATMSMLPGDVMTAVIPSVMSGKTITSVHVTPLTSMAQAMAGNMAGGMTGTNVALANTTMGNYFMVNDILHTHPMNPLVSGSSGTATQNMMNYGLAIAAMSQSARDKGMASSSSMVTAMMNDASDGVMNGMMGGTPVTMGGMMGGGMMGGSSLMTTTAGSSGLATGMMSFITSTMNRSGASLTDMQTLVNLLDTTSGQI